MTDEDEVHRVCQALIAAKDDAEVSVLASKLQRLQHELIEETRHQVRILPFLDAASKGKKAA